MSTAAEVLDRIHAANRAPVLTGAPRPAVIVVSEIGRSKLAEAAGWRGALDPHLLTTIFGIPIELDEASHPRAWGVLDEHREVIDCGTIDLS